MKRTSVLIAMLLAAVALTGCSQEPSGVDVLRGAETGSCVRIGDAAQDEWQAVECDGEEDRLYRVVEVVESTEDGACTAPDADRGVSLVEGEPLTLCLQMLPAVGECIYNTDDRFGTYFDCASGGGFVVTSVNEDTVDPAVCSETEQARVYETETRVVCFGSNG